MPASVIEWLHRALPGRHARGIGRATIVRLGIVAGAVLVSALAVHAFGRWYNFFDLRIYHGAVAWWWGGGELYKFVAPDVTLGFSYPPFAALVMLPMAPLPIAAAGFVNAIVSLAALAAGLTPFLVPIADRYGWPRWFAVALAVTLAAATEPVRETIGFGQVNLLLFGLVMADLVALRWRWRAAVNPTPRRGPLPHRLWAEGAWAGVGIGLATAIKLTPALFIFYLVVTRQWRPAITAIATTIGVTVGGFLVASEESFTYFSSVLWQTERVGMPDMTPNQSLAGLLARLYDSAETPGLLWLAFAMVMVALGLSRAATAHSEGDELAAFALVGLTANVISPISWTHHLVFVLPALLVLADTGLRRAAVHALGRRRAGGLAAGGWASMLTGWRHALGALGMYLLFVVSPIWRYEHRLPEVSHYADGLTGALAENSLAVALIVFVAALPWRPGAEPACFAEPALQVGSRMLRPSPSPPPVRLAEQVTGS
jgi:hypothetical protein